MPVAIKSLLRVCGNASLPGLQAKLYLTSKDELNGWPTVGTGAYGNAKTLTTAFTFVTTAGLGYWRELDILIDSGETRLLLEGNLGSKYWRNEFDFFIEGMRKEQLQLADDLVADSGCLIGLLALKGGTTLVMGDPNNPLFLSAAEGGANNEQVGVRYTMQFNNGLTPLIYNAGLAIDVTPNP